MGSKLRIYFLNRLQSIALTEKVNRSASVQEARTAINSLFHFLTRVNFKTAWILKTPAARTAKLTKHWISAGKATKQFTKETWAIEANLIKHVLEKLQLCVIWLETCSRPMSRKTVQAYNKQKNPFKMWPKKISQSASLSFCNKWGTENTVKFTWLNTKKLGSFAR